MADRPTRIEEEKETGRIQAFSDGVFSIAITLLVLDIKVPRVAELAGAHATLPVALLQQWPAYLAYLISFVTVLIMWMNHHRLFQHIRRTDHVFMLWNGLLLMWVTFVPFPTALIAEYINHPYGKVAAAIYSGTYVLIALTYNLLWRYASGGGRLLAKNHNPDDVAAITRQYKFGPAMYLVAFLLAFWSVRASVGACMLFAAFFILPGIRKTS